MAPPPSSPPSAAAAAARRRTRRSRRPLPLSGLVALVGAALSAAASLPARASAQCPISLTFYPDGGIGAINAPSAWSKRNQSDAGNDRDDALLPIALYGIPAPKLHAMPVSPVLGPAGTLVPGACTRGGPAAATRRRRELLQADGGPLAVPAKFSFRWSIDGGAPRVGPDGPAVNATTGALIFPAADVGGEVWNLKDGAHTLTLTFAVAAGSGRLADGTPVPAADLTVSRTAVFYKLLERPTAKVAVGTCQPSFTIGMTDMWPDAIPMMDTEGNVVPSSAAPGTAKAFLRPVYHLWGRFQEGMNGEAFMGEDAEHSREVHFFDRYYVREIGSPRKLDVEKADLAPGYYEANVEGSLTSDYPSLVALPGADTYGQEGTVYTSLGVGGIFEATDLSAKDKFSGAYVQGINGTRVGVQRSKTALLSMSGPDAPPAVGEKVAFNWQWHGLGNATCAVDGRLRGNVAQAANNAEGACTSPYTLTIPDRLNHTLSVTFSDVCGARRTETLTFGAERLWSTDAVLDGLAMADSALPLQDPMLGSAQLLQGGGGALGGGERAMGRGRNGAGGGAMVAGASSAALVLGAAVVAAVMVGGL